jgi:hypothetical protein
MKKNVVIVSIALLGLILVFTGNLWAAGPGGGRNQRWDKPSNPVYNPHQGRSLVPGIQHTRPVQRFIPRPNTRDYHPAPYRFAPRYHLWQHRPIMRPFHPKGFFERRPHAVVNEIKYYPRVAGPYYAPQDSFSAAATLSDAGFSVSVAVRDAN